MAYFVGIFIANRARGGCQKFFMLAPRQVPGEGNLKSWVGAPVFMWASPIGNMDCLCKGCLCPDKEMGFECNTRRKADLGVCLILPNTWLTSETFKSMQWLHQELWWHVIGATSFRDAKTTTWTKERCGARLEIGKEAGLLTKSDFSQGTSKGVAATKPLGNSIREGVSLSRCLQPHGFLSWQACAVGKNILK